MTADGAKARRAWVGPFSALGAVAIWSSWIVVSKEGTLDKIGALDLAAIRFGVSGVYAIPIVFYSGAYRTIAPRRIAALAITGGVPYALLLYFGFEFAPASHAGVLLNGLLPALAVGLGFLTRSSKANCNEVLGSLGILVGTSLAVGIAHTNQSRVYFGDGMFLLAAILFSIYLYLVSKWRVRPSEALLSLSVIGAVFYLPVWSFLPYPLATASDTSIALQVLYQGILAPIAGSLLISIATTKCGPVLTASTLSSVPLLSSGLSVWLLSEQKGAISWFGVLIATCGILLIAWDQAKRQSSPAAEPALCIR